MFPEDRFLEILIIGALALIVIGPKDLPVVMRKVGKFVGRMRNMAAEFRASFDELARQSELDELRREVEALRTAQQSAAASLNPMTAPQVKSTFEEIDQGVSAMRLTPPSSAEIPPPAPIEPEPGAAPAADPEPAPKPARRARTKANAKAAGDPS
jgi:sec-independent protein translocase protein TatB